MIDAQPEDVAVWPELHFLVPCWDVEGGEEFFSLGGRGPATVIWWLLGMVVTSCRPHSSRTILAMLIPVASWR